MPVVSLSTSLTYVKVLRKSRHWHPQPIWRCASRGGVSWKRKLLERTLSEGKAHRFSWNHCIQFVFSSQRKDSSSLQNTASSLLESALPCSTSLYLARTASPSASSRPLVSVNLWWALLVKTWNWWDIHLLAWSSHGSALSGRFPWQCCFSPSQGQTWDTLHCTHRWAGMILWVYKISIICIIWWYDMLSPFRDFNLSPIQEWLFWFYVT